MKHATLALALAFLMAPPTTAQDLVRDPGVAEAFDLLELWVDAQRDYERIPGISMGVVYDQRTLWSRGFGYADVERRTPAMPNTLYSICSISKLFTSIGVMQLRDADRLRLDDRVEQHLEWFDLQQTYPDAGPITIEGILTHSSGLPREAAAPYWAEANFPTRDAIRNALDEQTMLYPTRTYFQYSNLGLTLAGEIVAAASGTPYAEYIRREILDPLGMEDTHPDIPQHDRLATGYGAFRRDGTRSTVPFYHVNGIAPAAGFASTVEDLAAFASWQFRLLDGGVPEVLERNTLREMHRVHWLDPNWQTTWGLGFSVSRNDGTTFVGHGGSCPGYRTQLTMQTKEKFAAIFMTNAQGVNTGLYTRRAYEIVAPRIHEAGESEGRESLNPAFVDYLGSYERPLGGESAVVSWKGKLAVVSLPTENPLGGMTRLRHIEGDTFRRIRSDDELGEEFVFERDAAGNVVRMWRNNQYSVRRDGQ